MSCNPQTLSVLSTPFKAIPESNKLNVLIYIFCQISGVTIDPEVLSEAARCFSCIPEGNKMNVLLYLACNFQGGGPGQTCITCLAGSDAPVDPSACDCAIAYNMQGEFWFWDSGGATWFPIRL